MSDPSPPADSSSSSGIYGSSDFSELLSGIKLRKLLESYLGWKACENIGGCWLSSVLVQGSSPGGRVVDSAIADFDFCCAISCLTALSSEDAAVWEVTAVDFCCATSCLTASSTEDGAVWEGSAVGFSCGATSCVTTLLSGDAEGWEFSAAGGAFKLVVVSAWIKGMEGRTGKLGRVGMSAGLVDVVGGER